MPIATSKNMNLGCCITFGTFDIIVGWHWKHCKTYGKVLFICCSVCINAMLLGKYLVYPLVAFNNACNLLGIDFTSFYTTSTSILCLLIATSSKVIFASGEVFTKSAVLVHFVPKVFDRIHVKGLWTPCSNVIAWLLIVVGILVCFGKLSCWNTHFFVYFLNFTNGMLRLTCKMF